MVVLAIIAVMAIAVFIGSPLAAPEPLTAGFGMLPLAFVGSVTAEEIKNLVLEQGTALEGFKAHYTDRLDRLEARMNRPGFIMPTSPAGLSAEARKAFDAFARRGDESGMQRKAMSVGSNPDGGYLVPEEIDREIEKLINDMSPMRQIANVKPITSSDYKKIVNKGGLDAGWVGEEQSRADTGTPDLAALNIPPREVYAQPKITQTLLDDNGFDAGQWLIDEIAEAFLLMEGAAFISGDGVLRPRGLLTYPTAATADATRAFGTLQHVVSGSASTITADALVKTPFALKAGYRQGAVWTMNSTTAAVIMTLKDGQGRYLWMDGLTPGQPPTLAGYPVVTDENMPDIAGNEYPVAFGNFKRGYTIVDRRETTILRDPFTAKPYVKFYGTKRVGGGVVNFHAVKLMKIST